MSITLKSFQNSMKMYHNMKYLTHLSVNKEYHLTGPTKSRAGLTPMPVRLAYVRCTGAEACLGRKQLLPWVRPRKVMATRLKAKLRAGISSLPKIVSRARERQTLGEEKLESPLHENSSSIYKSQSAIGLIITRESQYSSNIGLTITSESQYSSNIHVELLI